MPDLTILMQDALFQHTIGFDRLLSLANKKQYQFPPYNLIKIDENNYMLVFAVAGFSEDNLEIEVKENIIIIKGIINSDNSTNYIHKGIAERQFKNSFELDKFLEVEDASLENGLLKIKLRREVPEQLKPKKIKITTNKKQILME